MSDAPHSPFSLRSAIPRAVSLLALGLAFAALALAFRSSALIDAALPDDAPILAPRWTFENLNRGESGRFHDLAFRIVRVESNDPADPNDDSAEISMQSNSSNAQMNLREGDTVEVLGFLIGAPEISPASPTGRRGEGSATLTFERLHRTRRHFVLRQGEKLSHQGLEIQIGRFNPRDPDDRMDDRVELFVTLNEKTETRWWEEGLDPRFGLILPGGGRARVSVRSVTPMATGEMTANEPIAEGEAVFEIVIEGRDAGPGGRPIG
jgi:hypothetical protein